MKRVTASRAALIGACAFPFRDGSPWEDSVGRSAVMGQDFHDRIAPVVDVSLPAVEKPITTKWLRERLLHAADWIEKNRVSGWRAEVAYAYDPQTNSGRILGYNIGREYEKHGKLPHEIAGSADIGWLSGDTACVDDWKTGRTVGAAAEAQLEWLGLFAARATGAWNAQVRALHVSDFGVTVAHEAFLDDVALWRIAEQLRADTDAVADAWPTPSAACDNCYCPARAGCLPYQALVQLHRKEAS